MFDKHIKKICDSKITREELSTYHLVSMIAISHMPNALQFLQLFAAIAKQYGYLDQYISIQKKAEEIAKELDREEQECM